MEIHPMTEEGPKIIRALGQVRRLHWEVASLLQTADRVLSEHGWRIAKSDSRALYETSTSIDKPNQWMPWEVYRYYRHDDHPSTLASLTVLLDDGQSEFPEPLITGSVIEFEDAQTAAGHAYWAGAFFRVLLKSEPDGRAVEVQRELLDKGWDFEFRKARCFAYPLVTVTSEEVLRQKIVGHLLAQLAGASG